MLLGGEEDRTVADLLDGKQRTHEREEQRWPAGNGGEGQPREQDKMWTHGWMMWQQLNRFGNYFLGTVGECDIFSSQNFLARSQSQYFRTLIFSHS